MRIAIFRALYLGDLLLAVPALRSIRAGFPHAEITLIGLPWAASFVRRFSHYADRFVEFAGYPGIAEVPAVPERTARFLEEQRAYGYDLVVQMHGSGEVSTRFALELGGRLTVGYYPGDTLAHFQQNWQGGELSSAPDNIRRCLDAGSVLAPYPNDQPEVLRNLGLARLISCPDRGLSLEFPLGPADRMEAAGLLSGLPRQRRPWIGMHPGAKSPARRWPAEHFAATADALAARLGAQVILTGGPNEEETVRMVTDRMAVQPLNLAGKTSLGGLGALIDELDLFISNDTGPAHLAQALGKASVIIFGPTDPVRWASVDERRHRIVRRPVECSPCAYLECPIDHRCLRGLSPAHVVEVAEQMLSMGAVA